MSTDLEKLAEQVRGLSPEEQRRLRHLLDAQSTTTGLPSRATEEAFQRHLVDAGLLADIKRPRRDANAFQRRAPLEIQGKPLSQTIVEERR